MIGDPLTQEATEEGLAERDSAAELQSAAIPEPASDRRLSAAQLAVTRWVLAAFVLLAFALRIYGLGESEFWFDEALTANVSSLGWQGIVAHLRSAPFEHPPLYFLALYPWQKLAGTSEFAFRLVSVFWGVLFVPLFYVTLRRWARRPLALLAALLAVLSPFLVAYSQEARMYTILPCLAALALLVFTIALQRERQPGWWLGYLALLVIGTATHYFFALVWLVTALYLGLEYLRWRRLHPWALAAHGLLLMVGVVWLAAAPGLRMSLAVVLQGETAFGLAYKLNKIMPALMVSEVSGGEVPAAAQLMASGGWLLVLLGVWGELRRPMLTRHGRSLLLLMLVVPLIAALLLPYGVLGRHLGYLLLPALTFLAVGLVALRRRGRLWLTLGILLLLLPISYGLAEHYADSGGSFGQAMAYVDQRAQAGDLLILNQPAQEPLVTYYNRGGWSVRYLPAGGDPLEAQQVAEALAELTQLHERLWLGPMGAWTADPDLLVERWLAVNAFQVHKIWFPDSSSVSLYYTDASDPEPVVVEQGVWDGRIRLQALSASPLQVSAGQALRLQFTWLAGADLDEAYAVNLRLIDDRGLVWADRRSEPCAGWCPTESWQAGEFQEDRHALLIPPGTPPGGYRLQVAWVPAAGGPPLPVQTGGGQGQQFDLVPIVVLPSPGGPGHKLAAPNPVQVSFGDEISLVGYQITPVKVQPGQELHLETHWQAAKAPTADYELLVEFVDGGGQVVHGWQLQPFTGEYATRQWQPGEYLRGQQVLSLRGDLTPGGYRLRMALLQPDGKPLPVDGEALGRIQLEGAYLFLPSAEVVDRPRRFDLPEMPQPLGMRLGRRAQLMGYDLDVSQAFPGGQLGLTLTWRALGPMVQPYKVFTHLVDGEGQVVAQHDGPPGNGCCPSNTWAEGEVIVDDHLIQLPANLATGSYDLVVGMYDEETLTSLPAFDGEGNPLASNGVTIQEVDVRSPPGGGQAVGWQETTPRYDHVLYLPMIGR